MPPSTTKLLVFGAKSSLRIVMSRSAPDVVHIGDMAIWPLGWLSKLRSRSARIVLTAHGTDVTYPRRKSMRAWLYGRYLRIGAHLLRGAVVVANSGATALETARYGFSQIRVVPLATDLKPIAGGNETPRDILFAGRLVPRKGLSWFVENVLPLLPPEIELRVAGAIWDSTEARSLNDPRVRFLGPLSRDRLAFEYSRAMCVVCPNIDVPTGEIEGFGMIATEAAAAGGISLAARHSGLTEAVIDGVTGFLIPPGNSDEWAKRILTVRDWSPEQRREFIRKATAMCAVHYSWSRVAADTLFAYRDEG